MDLEAMKRLTQNMKQVNERAAGGDSVSGDEGADLNSQGFRAYEEGDYAKAFNFFLRAAKAGNVFGMSCTTPSPSR